MTGWAWPFRAARIRSGCCTRCVELGPRWNLRLTVLHLDHQLRGEESRQDADFVRGMAERLGLPFVLRSVDVAASGDNLEQAAREARLEFFREQMAGGGLRRVALGHTRNDQAETVLFRFLRGAGTAGLAGHPAGDRRRAWCGR